MAAPQNHWKLGLFVVVGVVMTLATGMVVPVIVRLDT